MTAEATGTGARHEFRPSWAAWFWPLALTFGLALPFVWLRRRRTRYVVTDERVIRHRGYLSSSTDEFQLDDVTRIRTNRSLGERLLGGGTIVLDAGVDELEVAGVPNHDRVVSSLREAQSQSD